ncbi:MAG: hypothetical protein CMN30_15685 [Sandaracinus sp.]|nr:hypothetical protein [Sandaracinus sp.]
MVGSEPDGWLQSLLRRAGIAHCQAPSVAEARRLIGDDRADFLLESVHREANESFVVYAPAGISDAIPMGTISPAMNPAKLRGLVAHAAEWGRRHRAAERADAARTRPRIRVRQERELDGVLEETRVAYQPIRDRTGRVLGHEALLRVPATTSVSAGQVVERARSLGRTGDLLRDVLGEVVRDAPHLEGAIFVNLFWGDLHEEVLVHAASPVRSLADRLVLEVEVVAAGVEAGVERNALAGLGCRYLQGPLLGEPRFCTHGDVTKEVG